MLRPLLIIILLFSFQINAQNYKFLGGYDALGVPEYLESANDDINPKSMTLIENALPESYPVPDYNPHYISSGYDNDVQIEKDAAVWVTFVKEGAGYKNVLGFYTYDLNDATATKPQPEDITIIFPNVSASGSGGGLKKGNKVKIGDFKAGTGIGWVLLANGWNGSNVTKGNLQVFSNPKYNPESSEDLKQHMVLLADEQQERIYLGIEDIRRDWSNCDQDFNDAIFFVTANPYEAIKSYNYADIKSATDVSSANKGGLESDGKLAGLIAERNFNRLKNSYNKFQKSKQQNFKSANTLQKGANGVDLASLLPASGMFGTEVAKISSPEDLMGITNAEAVFSADYYEGDKRIAAALITKTKGSIYNHSKVICDRLNSASLEDIRTINLKGYDLVMIQILRDSGQLEYAVNFSISLNDENKLYSFWNIADYPAGDFANFQVWGGSMGQVSSIAGHIIDKFLAYNSLVSDKIAGKFPTLFVKRGFYKDGQLHLIVKNKNKDVGFKIDGNLRETELDKEISFTKQQSLSSDYEQEIRIDAGSLFDVGLQIKGFNSPQPDALYLADGPWGIDYVAEETQIDYFNIVPDTEKKFASDHRLERNIALSGKVFGTVNLFRAILPGDLAFDSSPFTAIEFDIKNSKAVELILVTEDLQDWDKRFRLKIEAHETLETLNLRLSDFTNGSQNYNNEPLKTIVFSVPGDYSSFSNFELNLEKVSFTDFRDLPNLPTEELAKDEFIEKPYAYNYPNPFKTNTTVVIPEARLTADIIIFDLKGRQVWSKSYRPNSAQIEFPVELYNMTPGMYKALIITEKDERFSINLLVK